MKFWKLVFDLGFGADFVRKAVITKENPFGDITPEEFKIITNEDFVKVVQKVQPTEVINPAPVNPQPTPVAPQTAATTV